MARMVSHQIHPDSPVLESKLDNQPKLRPHLRPSTFGKLHAIGFSWDRLMLLKAVIKTEVHSAGYISKWLDGNFVIEIRLLISLLCWNLRPQMLREYAGAAATFST